jgi:hypothetical protein
VVNVPGLVVVRRGRVYVPALRRVAMGSGGRRPPAGGGPRRVIGRCSLAFHSPLSRYAPLRSEVAEVRG